MFASSDIESAARLRTDIGETSDVPPCSSHARFYLSFLINHQYVCRLATVTLVCHCNFVHFIAVLGLKVKAIQPKLSFISYHFFSFLFANTYICSCYITTFVFRRPGGRPCCLVCSMANRGLVSSTHFLPLAFTAFEGASSLKVRYVVMIMMAWLSVPSCLRNKNVCFFSFGVIRCDVALF